MITTIHASGHSHGSRNGQENGVPRLGDAALLVFDCVGRPIRPDTKLSKVYASPGELRAFRRRLVAKAGQAHWNVNLVRVRITADTTFTDVILGIAH
jgi:hypothetical protein